jgi:hypothetical protein
MNTNTSREPENIRITNIRNETYSKNKPIFSHMDDKYVKATSMYSIKEIHKIAKCSPLMMKEIYDEHIFELQQAKQLQAKQLQAKQLQAKQLQAKQLQAKQLQAKQLQAKQNPSKS